MAKKKNKSKKTLILAGIISLSILVITGILYSSKKNTINTLAECEGGIYKTDNYYFKFPCGATVWNKGDSNSNVIVLLAGPLQRETVFHVEDALYLSFSSEKLDENETLKEYVQDELEAVRGMSEIKSVIEPVEYLANGLSGYMFKRGVAGIGGDAVATNYYLQSSQYPEVIIDIHDGSSAAQREKWGALVTEIISSYGFVK